MMQRFPKWFLFISLPAISTVSFVNMILMYFFPVGLFPFGSYFITSLSLTAYFLKAYFLLLPAVLICVLMFVTAFSVRKNRIVLPIALSVYLLIDLVFLACSFFGAWFSDANFLAGQAIQLVISIAVVFFLLIYLAARRAGNRG